MSKKNKTMSEEITTEGVSISHFQENIKANDNLKEVLKLALKQTSTTTREVLPKLSNAVVSYIKEFKENLKNQTVTDEMMNYISRSELAKHCYALVGYNRKDEVNDLFEKVVSRAIRLAIMIENYPSEFAVDEKTNEVFVMSKILEPKIEVKIKGSKITKKINNKDESLEPVSTYVVDKMYKAKYPTGTRSSKTKDEKTITNFKNVTNDFLKGFKKLIEYSSKQNVKFFDMIDEPTFENLEEIKEFLNSEDYQAVRTFSVEYTTDYNGKLERVANQ